MMSDSVGSGDLVLTLPEVDYSTIMTVGQLKDTVRDQLTHIVDMINSTTNPKVTETRSDMVRLASEVKKLHDSDFGGKVEDLQKEVDAIKDEDYSGKVSNLYQEMDKMKKQKLPEKVQKLAEEVDKLNQADIITKLNNLINQVATMKKADSGLVLEVNKELEGYTKSLSPAQLAQLTAGHGVEMPLTMPPEDQEWIYSAEGSTTDGLWVNPLLSGAAFFSHAEVCLNGTTLPADFQQASLASYSICNRAFTTKKIRKLYCGSEGEPLPCEDETKDPFFVKAAKRFQGGSYTDGSKCTEKGFRLSLDSTFLLSAPKNLTTLSVLNASNAERTNARLTYPLIRNGTKVTIRLFKNQPGGKNFGNLLAIRDKKYFDAQGTRNSQMYGFLDPEVIITKCHLVVNYRHFLQRQSDKTPTGEEKTRISSVIFPPTMKYVKDTFKTQIMTLGQGERVVRCPFTIPKGTRISYTYFPLHYQQYFSDYASKGTNYMLTYPDHVKSIKVFVEGKSFRFKSLKNLTSEHPWNEPDCHDFYQHCVDSGIYDNEFDEIFPGGNKQRWKDCIVMDFFEQEVKNALNCVFELEFEGPNLSPPGRLAVSMYVVEEAIIDDRGNWRQERVI